MGVEGRKRVRQCGPHHAYASMTPIHQNCVCTRLLALLSLAAASPIRIGGKQADRITLTLELCRQKNPYLAPWGVRSAGGVHLKGVHSPITLVSISL